MVIVPSDSIAIPYMSLGRIIRRVQGSAGLLSEQDAVYYDAILSEHPFHVPASFGFEPDIQAGFRSWMIDPKKAAPLYPHRWSPDEARSVPLNIAVGQTVQNTWIWARLQDGSWGMLEGQEQKEPWLQILFRWSEMPRYGSIEELMSMVSQTTWNRWFLTNDNRFRYQPPNRDSKL